MAKEAKFEQSLEKLEEIVDQLESGDLDLDKALKLYEEGVKLSQSCSKKLEEAQQKIDVLLRTASGKLKTQSAKASDLKSAKK